MLSAVHSQAKLPYQAATAARLSQSSNAVTRHCYQKVHQRMFDNGTQSSSCLLVAVQLDEDAHWAWVLAWPQQ
jgi:hypothetical protein